MLNNPCLSVARPAKHITFILAATKHTMIRKTKKKTFLQPDLKKEDVLFHAQRSETITPSKNVKL